MHLPNYLTENKSRLQLLQDLPKKERDMFIAALSDQEANQIITDPEWRLRPKQMVPDGDWNVLMWMAGRNFGKTYALTASLLTHLKMGYKNIGIIAAKHKEIAGVLVSRNPSSIMETFPPQWIPKWNKNDSILEWDNGAWANCYTAEDPEALRGPNFDLVLCDELAKYRYQDDIWEQLELSVRVGKNPRIIVATTPRPTALMRRLVAESQTSDNVKIVTGSSFENTTMSKRVQDKFERLSKTRMGRQEIYAELLDDNPDALFKSLDIDSARVNEPTIIDNEVWVKAIVKNGKVESGTRLSQIVVAIDPAVSNTKNSDEHGIVVVGKDDNGHGYILEDGSIKGSPTDWAKQALKLYYKYFANYIVAEVNQGGDMVEHTIHSLDRSVKVKKVRASRGKAVRAEPVSSLYEQHKIHHCGILAQLEDQMTMFDPSLLSQAKSPDRMDALVWGVTELLVSGPPDPQIFIV